MITSPRIRDGACRPYRIKTEYKEGSGDKGITIASVGKKDNKSDPILAIHPLIEQLRNEITETLDLTLCGYGNYHLVDGEVLLWLRDNSFSISSYLHLEGDTTDHKFPPEFMLYMEFCINRDKNNIGPAPDFLIWDHNLLVKLDNIRILIRVIEAKISELALIRDVTYILPILNRCSTYIFWLQRRVAKGLQVEEKYWQGKVSPFPIYKEINKYE